MGHESQSPGPMAARPPTIPDASSLVGETQLAFVPEAAVDGSTLLAGSAMQGGGERNVATTMGLIDNMLDSTRPMGEADEPLQTATVSIDLTGDGSQPICNSEEQWEKQSWGSDGPMSNIVCPHCYANLPESSPVPFGEYCKFCPEYGDPELDSNPDHVAAAPPGVGEGGARMTEQLPDQQETQPDPALV